MFCSWDRGQHHLELGISPGKFAEFFCRDRETNPFWGEDCADSDPLPPKIVEKLFPFCR